MRRCGRTACTDVDAKACADGSQSHELSVSGIEQGDYGVFNFGITDMVYSGIANGASQ